jgi:lipooligosaccharide transport system permease protein
MMPRLTALPIFSGRFVAVWRRNALVWRKLFIPSLVGNFGDPLLYLLGIGYGLGAFVGKVDDMPYLMFFASGLVCSSAMNTATFEGLYSAYTRMTSQRTWEGILATPLRLEDVVLGEVMWAATKSLVSGSAILVVAALLGGVHGYGAVAVVPLLFLCGLTFGAMALFVTAVAPGYDFFLYYFTLVVTPMFLFSGVFFPLTSLPPVVAAVAWGLPLTHAVAAARPLMAGLPLHGMLTHLGILAGYFLTFLLLSVVMLRRRLER